MKSDLQIQKEVMAEIQRQPFLHASEIGVAVKNGIVTLTGQVDSFSKKLQVEQAVKKVTGVKAIAEEISICVSPIFNKTDTEIAEDVLKALRWHSAVEQGKVILKVENGSVRLEGEVEWEFQRDAAKAAIVNLKGVRSVTNLILIKPKIKGTDIAHQINLTFLRYATRDAQKIRAKVAGTKVTLVGRVRSYSELKDAEDAAWAVPGVMDVDNKLEINLPDLTFED